MKRLVLTLLASAAISLAQQPPAPSPPAVPISIPAAYQPRLAEHSRIAAIEQYSKGSGQTVEKVLADGLSELVKLQTPNGSFGQHLGGLDTGMAVLAIAGLGKPQTEPNKKMLARAIEWIVAGGTKTNGYLTMIVHDPNPRPPKPWENVAMNFSILKHHAPLTVNARTYWPDCFDPVVHAIVTQALAEYYALEHDASVRPLLEKALKIILDAQHRTGLWNEHFEAAEAPNLWTTAYQVRALKSALASGLGGERATKAVSTAVATASTWARRDFGPKAKAAFSDQRADFWSGLIVASANGFPKLPFNQNAVRETLHSWLPKITPDLYTQGTEQGCGEIENAVVALTAYRPMLADDLYGSLVRHLVEKNFPASHQGLKNGPGMFAGLTSKLLDGHDTARFCIVLRALQAPFLFPTKR